MKPVVEGLKKSSGVKRSKAITSPLPKKAVQEGNPSKKGTMNVKGNPRLTAAGRGGGKNSKQIKQGEFAPVDRRVLEAANGWRVG